MVFYKKEQRTNVGGIVIGAPKMISKGDGSAFILFTLAEDRNYKNKEGTYVNRTAYYSCFLSGPTIGVFKKKVKDGTAVDLIGRVSNGTVNPKTGKVGNMKIEVYDWSCFYVVNKETKGDVEEKEEVGHDVDEAQQDVDDLYPLQLGAAAVDHAHL